MHVAYEMRLPHSTLWTWSPTGTWRSENPRPDLSQILLGGPGKQPRQASVGLGRVGSPDDGNREARSGARQRKAIGDREAGIRPSVIHPPGGPNDSRRVS